MYKQDLAWMKLQWLICDKTKQPTNHIFVLESVRHVSCDCYLVHVAYAFFIILSLSIED